MSETIVTLKKGEGRILKAGGMWVLITKLRASPEDLRMEAS